MPRLRRKTTLPIVIALCVLAANAFAGSGMPRGRGPAGWQVFVINTDGGIEYFVARGGRRLKYSFDVSAPAHRLASLEALEVRLRKLKRLQWVTVDQWNRGASADELALIKRRIGDICTAIKLGCVYSF